MCTTAVQRKATVSIHSPELRKQIYTLRPGEVRRTPGRMEGSQFAHYLRFQKRRRPGVDNLAYRLD